VGVLLNLLACLLHDDYWVFKVSSRPFVLEYLRSLRTMADKRITQYISPGAWALVSPSSLTQVRSSDPADPHSTGRSAVLGQGKIDPHHPH
jgi:hypothetical protein